MIDTPGGSVDITKDISQAIQQSSVPVIVYVAPSLGGVGGHADHVIRPSLWRQHRDPDQQAASPVDSSGADLPETAQHKAEESSAATARSLAARRGDDAVRWAEQTVFAADLVINWPCLPNYPVLVLKFLRTRSRNTHSWPKNRSPGVGRWHPGLRVFNAWLCLWHCVGFPKPVKTYLNANRLYFLKLSKYRSFHFWA